MNRPIYDTCVSAAERWSVPAMTVGTAIAGRVAVEAVGCASDTRFRAASVTKPFTALLAVDVLDLDGVTGVWPDEVRVRHLLSHTSGFDCELPERDLARFGDTDGALAAVVAELPTVDRLVGIDEIW